ncbi:ABC1 family-domain-containing protein [Chytriomyces cf. hyalinus JEL632]|nr:ABC1 family-domain-containing protein [Chytriomyces cf. hyalinus JEL632]
MEAVIPHAAHIDSDVSKIEKQSEIVATPIASINPLRLCFRVISLLFLFTPVLFALPFWLLIGNGRLLIEATNSLTADTETSKVLEHDWFMHLTTHCFEYAGPVFIKLCQWASMRQDLFHPAELVDLHFGSVSKRNLIVSDVFERFDSEPVGVGAVAQVHLAVLKSQFVSAHGNALADLADKRVAVKVIHPRIEHIIEMDLTLLQMGGRIFSQLIPGSKYLAIDEELDTFAGMMRRQLDLTIEFRNLAQFKRNFEGEGLLKSERPLPIAFPTPLIASRNVLVEEFCDGVGFRKIVEIGHCAFDEELVQIGLPAFVRMIMKHNFVHADLHAGNILLQFKKETHQKSGKSIDFIDASLYQTLSNASIADRLKLLEKLKEAGYTPHLVFLDVGLTSALSQSNLSNIQSVVNAALDGKGDDMADLFMTRCRDPSAVIDPEGARREMKELIQSLGLEEGKSVAGILPLSVIKSRQVLMKAAQFFRQHRIGLEGEWIGLFVAAVLVEGIARKLGGDVDVIEVLMEEM